MLAPLVRRCRSDPIRRPFRPHGAGTLAPPVRLRSMVGSDSSDPGGASSNHPVRGRSLVVVAAIAQRRRRAGVRRPAAGPAADGDRQIVPSGRSRRRSHGRVPRPGRGRPPARCRSGSTITVRHRRRPMAIRRCRVTRRARSTGPTAVRTPSTADSPARSASGRVTPPSRAVYDGDTVYVQGPDLRDVQRWQALGEGHLVRAGRGRDSPSSAAPVQGDPGEFLTFLEGAGGAAHRRSGTEDVRGVPTRHVQRRLDMQKVARPQAAGTSKREKLEEHLTERGVSLAEPGPHPRRGLDRRRGLRAPLLGLVRPRRARPSSDPMPPPPDDSPGPVITETIELYDFDEPIDVDDPAGRSGPRAGPVEAASATDGRPAPRRSVGSVRLEILEAGEGGRPAPAHATGSPVPRRTSATGSMPSPTLGWWVVAPDLRGHGASDQPDDEDEYSLATFAA